MGSGPGCIPLGLKELLPIRIAPVTPSLMSPTAASGTIIARSDAHYP